MALLDVRDALILHQLHECHNWWRDDAARLATAASVEERHLLQRRIYVGSPGTELEFAL